jgi:RNA polymerase sigma factor (sigma-70 family)
VSKSSSDLEGLAQSRAEPSGIGLRRPDELLALARAAAERDPTAASTLVQQVGGAILSTVRQVLGAKHPDIEDVAQEAVIAFLSALKDFRGECATQSYAQRVALFTALAARRRLVARERLFESGPEAEFAPASDADSPHAEALAARRREILTKVLDSLPDVIAEALALHFILGYTVDEIAVATQAPPNTIWSRLRLGKQSLRKTLKRNARLMDLFGSER